MFLWFNWHYEFWGRRPQSIPFSAHHKVYIPRIRYITADVILDRLSEMVFVRFLHHQFVFSPFYGLFFSSKLPSLPPILKVRRIQFCLLEKVVCAYIIWNSVRKMCPFSPFIYLLNHLFLSVWIEGYLKPNAIIYFC